VDALAIFSFLLAISRADRQGKLIEHVQGRTETGRGAIISNLCHSLDGSKERTAEKKGNYRASRRRITWHSIR